MATPRIPIDPAKERARAISPLNSLPNALITGAQQGTRRHTAANEAARMHIYVTTPTRKKRKARKRHRAYRRVATSANSVALRNAHGHALGRARPQRSVKGPRAATTQPSA